MPLSPLTLTPVIAANLLATGHTGTGMTQLATGVALGTSEFLLQTAKVITVDVGSLGAGTSIAPLIVPQPLLLAGILAGFAAQQILGIFSPLTATGLANGLSLGLLTGILQTNHVGVGTGTGVARVLGGSAIPLMLKGFKEAGMKGPGTEKKATAMGIALDIVFGSFSLPIAIVGSAAPSPGVGAGFGFIV